MHITFVKKILKDGEPCAKCLDVEQRLTRSGYLERIDEVVVADESNPDSAGMRLAAQHNVSRAPFFVVQDGDEVRVHDVYFKFVREEMDGRLSQREEAQELLRDNPELDLL